MPGMKPFVLVIACSGILTSAAHAQNRFALSTPDTNVRLTRDLVYAVSDTVRLRLDIYSPPNATTPSPALLFFNRGTGEGRATPWTVGWARAAAARGLVAILPDLREGSEARDFQHLLTFLVQHGGEIGVDSNAIAVYAASGNVFVAFPFVEDPAQSAIKAAVMYYGTADVSRYRLDLPVLFVRAGLDRPPVNQRIAEMAVEAVSQNAPLQLLNHPTGYHGFEVLNDDDATRDIIVRTIDFVKQSTKPSFQDAIRKGITEAAAAGYVMTGQTRAAADTYALLVSARPDEPRLRLAYGEALLADTQYRAACAEFEKLKDKGLGARDLGLPAARACMLADDPDAAVAWLRTIPSRFLPASVRDEAVFAPLRGRADFRALFGNR
jgi:dienelactone hydrolase